MGADGGTRRDNVASHLRSTACQGREDWLSLLGSRRTERAAGRLACKAKGDCRMSTSERWAVVCWWLVLHVLFLG